MGFLDILSAIIIILFHLEIVAGRILLSFILYLIIKGFMFKGDTASIIDFIIAIYLLFMYIRPIWALSIISCIYLVQKGFYSLI